MLDVIYREDACRKRKDWSPRTLDRYGNRRVFPKKSRDITEGIPKLVSFEKREYN
jgi:hypothetical protein